MEPLWNGWDISELESGGWNVGRPLGNCSDIELELLRNGSLQRCIATIRHRLLPWNSNRNCHRSNCTETALEPHWNRTGMTVCYQIAITIEQQFNLIEFDSAFYYRD